MAEAAYNRFKKGLADADEDWPGGDYRSLLLVGALTFDAADVSLADVIATGNTEASDGSYARVAYTTKVNTQDDVNDRADLGADTLDYGALDNETPTALITYRHVDGTNANDLPAGFHDTNFGTPANGAGYQVQWPNDAIRIT
jgi:hypothetical protein